MPDVNSLPEITDTVTEGSGFSRKKLFLAVLLAALLYIECIPLHVINLFLNPANGEMFNGEMIRCDFNRIPLHLSWGAISFVLVFWSVVVDYQILKRILKPPVKFRRSALLLIVLIAIFFISCFNYGGAAIPNGYEWEWLGVKITWGQIYDCN